MSKRKVPSEEDHPNHDFCEFLIGKIIQFSIKTLNIGNRVICVLPMNNNSKVVKSSVL